MRVWLQRFRSGNRFVHTKIDTGLATCPHERKTGGNVPDRAFANGTCIFAGTFLIKGWRYAFCEREGNIDRQWRMGRHEHLSGVHPWLHLLRQPQQLLPVHPLFRGYRGEAERTGAPGGRPSIQAKEDHGRYRVHVRPLYALRGKPGTDPTMS